MCRYGFDRVHSTRAGVRAPGLDLFLSAADQLGERGGHRADRPRGLDLLQELLQDEFDRVVRVLTEEIPAEQRGQRLTHTCEVG